MKISILFILFISLQQLSATSLREKHQCIHDQSEEPEAQFSESNALTDLGGRRNLEEEEWQPLRITFDTTNIQSLKKTYPIHLEMILKTAEVAKQFGSQLLIKRNKSNNKFPRYQQKCVYHYPPQEDRTIGIPDSDLHIYLTQSTDQKFYFAFANVCARQNGTNRPLFGQINFNMFLMKYYQTQNPSSVDDIQEIFIHELVHVLALTSGQFKYFIDPSTGRPYRQPTKTIYSGPQKGTYVQTPKLKEFVQQHFNCSEAIGMKLADGGSHWNKEYAENEALQDGKIGHDAIYSNFTFKLLEDSGWYKPTYKNVDPADWGKNQGCQFLKTCFKDKAKKEKFREYTQVNDNQFCNFYHNTVTNTKQLGIDESKCYVPRASTRFCYDPTEKADMETEYTGEKFGIDSRCFESNLSAIKGASNYTQADYQEILGEARCFEYQCNQEGDISVVIHGEKYEIDRNSNQVQVEPRGSNTIMQGVVYGPEDWHSFCFRYPKPCKNWCSGNGYCQGKSCQCGKEFAGDDCSIPCSNGNYVQDGVCLHSQQCSYGYIVNESTKECIRQDNGCQNNQISYNGQCVDNCPLRTFQSNFSCIPCSDNCLLCQDKNSCEACTEGYYDHNGACVKQCPEGFYEDQQQMECKSCQIGCSVCENGSSCLECSGSQVLLRQDNGNDVCVVQCPQRYYQKEGKCLRCAVGCKQCSNAQTCDTCDNDRFTYINYEANTKQCLKDCIIGSFMDFSKRTCYTCKSSQVFHNYQCQDSCPSGFYQNEQSCLECDKSCKTCGNGQSCESCPYGQEIDSETQLCVKASIQCLLNCQKCSSQRDCEQCKEGTYLYQYYGRVQCLNKCPGSLVGHEGKCVQRCPSDMKVNQSLNICEACDGSCDRSNSGQSEGGTGNKKCGPIKYEYISRSGFSFCISRCFGRMQADSQGVCRRK